MEIKAELKKPYTEEQRINFIVQYNHKQRYEIKETDTSLIAFYEIKKLTPEQIEQAKANAYDLEIDPLHARKKRKIILGTWTEEDEENYIKEVKRLSKEISQRYI